MFNYRGSLMCGRLCLLPLLLLLLTARIAWSQVNEQREHFQLKIGGFYDQGDFGSLSTTKTLFAPITLRYLGDGYDVSVTPSFALVDSAGGVRLIDGTLTRTGQRGASIRDTRSGLGDTLVRGR